MKVLVVEDIEINRVVLQMILEELNCSVEWAEDGNVAIEMAERTCYDLVFMDLQMPHCDGFEATRRIRSSEICRKRPHLPIYALSANSSEDNRKLCVDVGMNGFVAKPITVGMIREVLEQVDRKIEAAQGAVW